MNTLKKYHTRAIPALTCFALAGLALYASTHTLYMAGGLVLLGLAFAIIKGEGVSM